MCYTYVYNGANPMTPIKYKGYTLSVEFESGIWLVYKGKKVVYTVSSRTAARKWIDARAKKGAK